MRLPGQVGGHDPSESVVAIRWTGGSQSLGLTGRGRRNTHLLAKGDNVPIPTYKNIELPLLRVIVDAGGELRVDEAVKRVEAYFPALAEEDKRKRRNDGRTLVWRNTVRYARWQLVKKGYLYHGPRGACRITPEGRAHLDQHWPTWQPHYSPTDDDMAPPPAEETIREIEGLPKKSRRVTGPHRNRLLHHRMGPRKNFLGRPGALTCPASVL